ncbi:MAG: hypothetical protein AAFQ05_02015, partial [Pseudomonadota bacterium]
RRTSLRLVLALNGSCQCAELLKGLTDDVEGCLKKANIAPTDRAEVVPLEKFCALARAVQGKD